MFNPVAWFVAKRYLFSKKSHSVINLISIISIIAVAVPVAAMIILLSVVNGFIDLTQDLNQNFDPNIRISLKQGEYFDQNSSFIDSIQSVENVKSITQYIEGDCVISCNDLSQVITLRGIDSAYINMFPIENAIVQGKYNKYNMLLGSGIDYEIEYILGVSGQVVLYAPSIGGSTLFGMNKTFNSDKISVSGVFMLDTYTDSKYAIAPLLFSQTLLGRDGKISAIGVSVHEINGVEKSVEIIKKIVPNEFSVKDSFQQRELEYSIIEREKTLIFIMLVFIMIIASLTLVGAVMMMMIEKREQMYVIGTMGGDEKLKKTIFKYQSLVMTFIGGALGIFVGIGFVLLQQYFEFIKIGSDSVLVDSYPVILNFYDIILVFGAVILIGYFISVITTASRPESVIKD